MTVNDAMVKAAEQLAREYGYIEVREPYRFYARKSDFWGDISVACKNWDHYIMRVRYIYPMFDEDYSEYQTRSSYGIDIDMYWGRPRLNVRLRNGNACHLAYKDDAVSEVQAFGPHGIELALRVREMIDNFIAQ